MDIRKTNNLHKELCSLISQRKIKQALDLLHQLIVATSSGELTDEFHNISSAYRNMLEYTINGVDDPERGKIFTKLAQSTLKLADRTKEELLSKFSGWNTYWIKQQTEKEQRLASRNIVETVDDLLFKSELDQLLYPNMEQDNDPFSESTARHKLLIKNIFNHLWLTDYYGEAEESLIKIIFGSDKFKWYESSIFTSAITLSLFRIWQAEKIYFLFMILNKEIEQVTERALTGLIINLHHYNNRIQFYPDIIEAMNQISKKNNFKNRLITTGLQIIRSRETEDLSNKLKNEIIPKMSRYRPQIEEKLNLDDILSDAMEGKNPDWQAMFIESEEIFNTMEELSKLQMEGADIYMSAFSNLKNFDFFKEFHNWFLPFYPDHEVLNEVFTDEILGPGTNELAEAMSNTAFICNSDKYSLVYNLKHLPPSQKKMMVKVFRMELENIQDLGNDDLLSDSEKWFKINITQYIQDLYRFFKLSPYKKEFEDIFNGKLDIYNSKMFKIICNEPEDDLLFADYFFNKNFYEDANEIFLRHTNNNPEDQQLYEKIGYCYQETYNYEKALEFYRRAEIIDRKAWTIKKIGLCLRQLNRTNEALEYYLQAGDMEPDNIHTTMMIGHCYLDTNDYENALTYYFKVEYNNPGNIKILRPIAYCYLAMKRFDDSDKYYNRLANDKLSVYDLINMGHLALCKNNKKMAIDYYRRSIENHEMTKEKFSAIFNEDRTLLTSLGIDLEELSLILDYLYFTID